MTASPDTTRHQGLSAYEATRAEIHPAPHMTRTVCGQIVPTLDLLAPYMATQPDCPICFPMKGVSPMSHKPHPDTSWYQKATQYIEAYAATSYRTQRAAWLKKGRSPRTFRFAPDTFHQRFTTALGIWDDQRREETVKAMMLFPDQFKD